MANLRCPKCSCPITVDRGVRRGGVVYCCQSCVEGLACEFDCPAEHDPAKGGGGPGVILHD
ncbi:MAG TPA: hypothetical protein VEI94_02130 [Candidatus Bathyarchaeia archaeon]|jgi:hypothetical protein|nr:hypothetical protein [Candidatus Bathyarchaeia archaeon]